MVPRKVPLVVCGQSRYAEKCAYNEGDLEHGGGSVVYVLREE